MVSIAGLVAVAIWKDGGKPDPTQEGLKFARDFSMQMASVLNSGCEELDEQINHLRGCMKEVNGSEVLSLSCTESAPNAFIANIDTPSVASSMITLLENRRKTNGCDAYQPVAPPDLDGLNWSEFNRQVLEETDVLSEEAEE